MREILTKTSVVIFTTIFLLVTVIELYLPMIKSFVKKKPVPRYEHDCDHCVFLGYEDEYDLYYCDHNGSSIPTVIARYGPDGEYMSGMSFAEYDINPVLFEAKNRAISIGLYENEVAVCPECKSEYWHTCVNGRRYCENCGFDW